MKYYRFANIWNLADFHAALGIFTRCEYGTIWSSPKVSQVSGSEEDMRLAERWAEHLGGIEIPPPC